MKLINLANGSVLADRVAVADSFAKRLKGLIGRRAINRGEALILYPCKSVHTCFLNFPIDVLFIDREALVLHILESMRPYRLSPVISLSYMVVELPAGCVAATGTEAGHRLKLTIKC
ncbi:MAG: DUF192 domain-containing protein [Firmicutes bacterium]|nr:DUF192 domain-containing protein [Bacillota bacterium]